MPSVSLFRLPLWVRSARPRVLPSLRRPRHELALLAVVAVATLGVLNLFNVQDQSRYCLTDALVHARLAVGDCVGTTGDRSTYGGRVYSNKAPGMSVLAVAPQVLTGYHPSKEIHQRIDARLWLMRLFSCGFPFLALVLLVGRACETLSPRTGSAAIVVFGLGTPIAPFAVTAFDHAPAALFGFASFLLAWRSRHLGAGLAAGAAVLTEYEAAAVLAVVGAYALVSGRRAAARYALGVIPGCGLLAAYDWAAFGAPWHTPLPYSDNEYRAIHKSGVLGVHAPNLHSTTAVFAGRGGLLVLSPVLVAAAFGLSILWRRRYRAEVAVCIAVAAAFVLAECGYGDPYGGDSPLPRYLIPALPFVCVGLGPALTRFWRATTALAALSVAAMTAVTLTWTMAAYRGYPEGIWKLLARVPSEGMYSWLAVHATPSVFGWAGAGAVIAVLAAMTSIGALIVAAVCGSGDPSRYPAPSKTVELASAA